LDANYAIGNFIREALHGDTIQIRGDGTPHRSYLYAADLAIWLWTILIKGQACYPYNVGSEEDVTIAQLAREVAQELSPGSIIQIATPPVEGKPAERYVPSTHRARQELGLDAWIPLAEAIRRTAKYHLR
jgi:dTDP-glucose 4,6-dehydratase